MKKKIILCWGDSITEGMAMKRTETYPAFLGQMLGDGYRVLNGGAGGEKTDAIMVRQGAYRAFLDTDVTFRDGEAVAYMAHSDNSHIKAESGNIIWLSPTLENEIPVNPITIDGGKYSFFYEDWSWSTLKGSLMLRRENTNGEITLKKGTEIFYNSVKFRNNAYANLVFMGTNGLYTDEEDLLRQHKLLVGRLGTEHYVVVTPPFHPDFDKRYEEAFGKEHTFSLRGYLTTERAFKDVGAELTEEDMEYISRGELPPTFTWQPGNKHLSATGYRAMAYGIYTKLKESGAV